MTQDEPTIQNRKPKLPYLELHLANGCNLNCRGCSHFSPLFDRNSFPDANALLWDIARLAALFDGIGHLRLLGGEPLLNPDLLLILPEIRRLLPESRLTIVTNGLLADRLGESFIEAVSHLDIAVRLTSYPATQQTVRQTAAQYQARGIDAQASPLTSFFRLFLRKDRKNGFQRCELRHCVLLHNGRLWRCSIAAFISVYNQAFGCRYPEEAGIDIYDSEDGWSLLSKLDLPGELCQFCYDDRTLQPWQQTNHPLKNDWIADKAAEDCYG